jgi:hypothetical protein
MLCPKCKVGESLISCKYCHEPLQGTILTKDECFALWQEMSTQWLNRDKYTELKKIMDKLYNGTKEQ